MTVKQKCADCDGTGYVGDKGVGISGNSEYVPCDNSIHRPTTPQHDPYGGIRMFSSINCKHENLERVQDMTPEGYAWICSGCLRYFEPKPTERTYSREEVREMVKKALKCRANVDFLMNGMNTADEMEKFYRDAVDKFLRDHGLEVKG